jgi:hypothetical protein
LISKEQESPSRVKEEIPLNLLNIFQCLCSEIRQHLRKNRVCYIFLLWERTNNFLIDNSSGRNYCLYKLSWVVWDLLLKGGLNHFQGQMRLKFCFLNINIYNALFSMACPPIKYNLGDRVSKICTFPNVSASMSPMF